MKNIRGLPREVSFSSVKIWWWRMDISNEVFAPSRTFLDFFFLSFFVLSLFIFVWGRRKVGWGGMGRGPCCERCLWINNNLMGSLLTCVFNFKWHEKWEGWRICPARVKGIGFRVRVRVVAELTPSNGHSRYIYSPYTLWRINSSIWYYSL